MTFAFGSPATIFTSPNRWNWVPVAKALRCCHGPTLQGDYQLRFDNGSQTSTTHVVIEGFGRRPLGLEAKLDTHPRCVHHPAIAEIVELLAVDFGIAIGASQRIENPQPESRYRQRNSARPPDRLRQHDDPVGADVEGAGLAGHRGALQRTQRILLVQE